VLIHITTHLALAFGAITAIGIARWLWPYNRLAASIVFAFPVVFFLVELIKVLEESYRLIVGHPFITIPALIVVVFFAWHYLSVYMRSLVASPMSAETDSSVAEESSRQDISLREFIERIISGVGTVARRHRLFLRGVLYAAASACAILVGFISWSIWDSRRSAEREWVATVERELNKIRDAANRELNRVATANVRSLTEDFARTRVDAVKRELVEAQFKQIDEQARNRELEAERLIDSVGRTIDRNSRSNLIATMKRDLEAARTTAITAVDRSFQELEEQVLKQVTDEFTPRIQSGVADIIQPTLDQTMARQLASARTVLAGSSTAGIGESSSELLNAIIKNTSPVASGLVPHAAAKSLSAEDGRINVRIRELMETVRTKNVTDAQEIISKTFRMSAEKAKSDAEKQVEAIRRQQELDEARIREQQEAAARRAREAEEQRKREAEAVAALKRFQVYRGRGVASTNVGALLGPAKELKRMEDCALLCLQTNGCAIIGFAREPGSTGLHWCYLYPRGAHIYENPPYDTGVLR
jgi:hypothetical protein